MCVLYIDVFTIYVFSRYICVLYIYMCSLTRRMHARAPIHMCVLCIDVFTIHMCSLYTYVFSMYICVLCIDVFTIHMCSLTRRMHANLVPGYVNVHAAPCCVCVCVCVCVLCACARSWVCCTYIVHAPPWCFCKKENLHIFFGSMLVCMNVLFFVIVGRFCFHIYLYTWFLFIRFSVSYMFSFHICVHICPKETYYSVKRDIFVCLFV
jgi:hypothetical protein